MVTAFIRIDLPDRSPDFQRIALEPGVPLLDRGQTTSRLLRVWLGRFVGEPEWVDSHTLQFYLNDDQGRRIDPSNLRLVTSKDLAGILRGEIQALREKLAQIQPRGRTEQTVVTMLRERLATLEKLPEQACSDGALFRYRDSQRKWRLIWCWGYQRSESKIVRAAICVKPDCRRLYLVRNAVDPKCPKCQTPMPVFRFPWKRVGLAAACLLVMAAYGGWRYWSTLPRSSISGQVVWSGFNVPIAGAEIRIDSLNRKTLSDADGRFQLDHLPAGVLDVSVTAEGFPESKIQQEVAQSEQITVPISVAGDRVLKGRVVDSVSREPLPNAKLQVAGTSETILADAKGEFQRDGFHRGGITVQVTARGYPPVEKEIELGDDNNGSLDLEVTGNSILLGRVISASQEKPLADAIVRLESCGQTVKTDADGWYAFRSAPNGPQPIVVELDGFATERTEKELASAQERQASFRLAGAAKVLGNVVRAADMSPMSGVEVRVAGTRFTTTTDDNGRFELRGIMAGKATIDVTAAGFAPASFDRELSNVDETVLSVKLRGDATIMGLVTDEVTKQPVAEVDVRLVGLPYQTRTDAEGKYLLDDVPSLPARIDARTAGYIAMTVEVRPVAKEKSTVALTIRGNATLSGRVIEQWSQEPVPKAKLKLAKSGHELVTGDDGKFEIQSVRGGAKHELLVEADGLTTRTETIDVKPGPNVPLTLILAGAAQQEGRVVSAIDETPLAGAKVQLLGTTHQAMADGKGQFKLDKLRSGPITLEVSATGFETRRVTQEVTGDSKPISILLGGNAAVTGEVLDGVTGLPVVAAEIRIAKTVLKATTDKQGAFHLEGAFPGTVMLTAQAEGYPPVTEPVKLVAERETSADFTLTGTASIAGEVFDDVGKPVANATVQWEDTRHTSTTGARGEFQLAKLRGGAGRINISAPKFARKSVSVDLKAGASQPLGRLMLLSSLTLRGQVVHAVSGEPLANAALSIASLGQNTTSDAQGQFKFDGLPAKSHDIKIEAPGFVAEVASVNPTSHDDPELFALCPLPKPDEVIIVLTWRGGVLDLDGHLFREGATGSAAHVVAARPRSDNLSVLLPNQNGRGPETLRIHPLKPGRYEFLVQLPPGENPPTPEETPNVSKQLSRSEAMVKIYRSGQSQPALYRVGRNKSATVWWPLALEIAGSGSVIEHVYKAEHYRNSLPALGITEN